MVAENREAWRAERGTEERAQNAPTAAGWRSWVRSRGAEQGVGAPATLKLTHVLIALVAGYAILAGLVAVVWLFW